MTKTLDLINAIEAGQSQKIQSIFEELLNTRLIRSINQKRAEIADFVFNGSKALNEERIIEEMTSELSQYDAADLFDFMVTEEFAKLDGKTKQKFGHIVKHIA